SDQSNARIAHAFQQAELPMQLVGDLRALIAGVHSPLAIRSSSMLEDAMYEPFAGIYGTKMIPNNQLDTDTRFRKLVEAIKFVYASVFFKEARDYFKATRHDIEDEKMAVIIQEVVGKRFNNRFYPHISGVARSYNFYPTGKSRPEDGVVNLALGLGKMIVDEGIGWFYSPTLPRANPPYNSVKELMKQTQTEFWAVNMGKPPAYDPIKETEYLLKKDLSAAEEDDVLRHLASTYNPQSDRVEIGTGNQGARILNFAPVLVLGMLPLNNLIKKLLPLCEDKLGTAVEVEFAMTLGSKSDDPSRFGFLQVRPMVVSDAKVDIQGNEMSNSDVIIASERAMGNGIIDNIRDIIYVKPENFEARNTQVIAEQLETFNRMLVEKGTPYLLIGFGRWGSSDPWLGIPVYWGQINGAKVMVEATLPNMHVDLSQGSHFFHNLSSFQVSYFSVPHAGKYQIDWNWLNSQPSVSETDSICHVQLKQALIIKVDGRSGRGVILKPTNRS
ncbi:hypothetical protein GF337_16860, partial [candidate division KSB1 bacterium]|nr:hypothetical protein [candidate division KSB1 bacterium]